MIISNKKLTVIITFLNEKEDVKNTIESILEFSDDNVEIIVINDASDDNYDYDKLAVDYNITYVKNKIRLGVAASRDLGVSICKTAYFLLLDAHMRFYDNKWITRIVEELSKNTRRLLCTQTKILKRKDDIVYVDKESDALVRQGATVKLNGNILFEPKWLINENKNLGDGALPIACVLGAGYACSKDYWIYLKGLSGLMYYGNDEAYISMKSLVRRRRMSFTSRYKNRTYL
ncbi:MAG: glycosyltransferase [Tannerella sp.]|jgi:glycosyltransferase involved in cell wall biosynthesis|nr:glycosyltransferase [Tannerella sp.]